MNHKTNLFHTIFSPYLLTIVVITLISSGIHYAGDTVRYTGTALSNIDYHHGQLRPAVGVHNIQVMRANRENPNMADGFGWTYNHAPMLAHWNNTFYSQYLSNPVGEHIPPSQTFLVTSADGYNWDKPVVVFPPYKVPDGTVKDGRPGRAKDLYAVMHQRMGFYVSEEGRLFTLGYYGICFDERDSPNDGKGIGRVIREIYPDGSFGHIYFIRFNAGWNRRNTSYPFFDSSRDKGLVKACNEILSNPLILQHWNEESDRDDPLIPMTLQFKAFNYYHLPDNRVVGLWKHAVSAISNDGGKTWPRPERAQGFVNGNAKIWGQQTSDGRFATVYNPSEFRWPLAVSVSEDGLDYHNLLLVNGEISTMRYGGNYKSYGPQYVRGILEGNGLPDDGKMWLTYSMNKEDIWIASVPAPITDLVTDDIDETFDLLPDGEELKFWNIFSPRWAKAGIKTVENQKFLALHDKDPYDYALAERVIPQASQMMAEFTVIPGQNAHGSLQVEFLNEEGLGAIRLIFDDDGLLKAKNGYRYSRIMDYNPGESYHVRVELDCTTRSYQVFVNGEEKGRRRLFYRPVHNISRIAFRTGDIHRFPDADTPTNQDFDVENPGIPVEEAVFLIKSFKTIKDEGGAILKYEDFRHHVDYFNRMEDENIVQAIPNEQSWDWMKSNIPLFECPQDNFEQMFYYRWWTLRKHIKETPVGHIMTEFLVERSYADKFNLIACAMGHHIMESRWLHEPKYMNEYIHVWFRGNDGKPMKKVNAFSNWTSDALYNKYLVDGNLEYLLDMLPDMIEDYKRWEEMRRFENGMFWQRDVQDGMEESISGGRRVKNIRPTINSYMYANARAISKMAALAGDTKLEAYYQAKADTLYHLVHTRLWNPESKFFETIMEDGNFAEVREAIGYIPWYFNIPVDSQNIVWKQLMDEQGFLAPYGQTTAERRHPEFRTRGCCSCEWDGAVWPFATSQTLTGLANFFNTYEQEVITKEDYFKHMELYVESQYHRGRPYIGEYLDEVTGYWLKGDQERSRYYNHSTFNDLIITGLVGFRPRPDNVIEVNPLLPEDKWDWFCIDNVLYRGNMITIIWDRDGTRYNRGKGLQLLVNGKKVTSSENLERLQTEIK